MIRFLVISLKGCGLPGKRGDEQLIGLEGEKVKK